MEKLLFPTLEGKWYSYIQLDKYVELLQEDFCDDTPDYPFLNPSLMGEWINLLHKTLGYNYSWGGYLEDRNILLHGTYLQAGHRLHLGIDFWVPANSCVHLPKKGKLVQSRYDNDLDGGWGGQAIFEIDGLYVIFGHLKNIADQVGETYQAGAKVGLVAETGLFSGGWYPHLHLQCMKQFNPNVDGYGYPSNNLEKEFPNPKEVFHVVG